MSKVRANPKFSISKADGTPAASWKVNFYVAGTSTRKDTYTDYTENTSNANPVILDARGEADIWPTGAYKVVLTDENDVTIWTVDNWGSGEGSAVITGNYNSVKNGSFETDDTTSGEPDDWTIVDYTGGSHSLDSTDQFHGLKSLKFVSTGNGGGYATSDYFEVEEAKANNIDWNMKSSVADVRNVVDMLWYTSAKTLISTTNLYDDSTTNVTSWSAKSSQATPPSTARYAQIRIYGCHSSDSTSGTTWYDNIEAADNLARRHTVNTFTQTQTWSKGAVVASAAALTLGSDGNYFDVTGTTAITSIVTKGIGTVIKLHFDGILTITHHATNLILPGGANITTAAGDEAEFIEYASGDWRCTNYFDDKIVPYAGSARQSTLDAAISAGTGLSKTTASDLYILDVALANNGTGTTTQSIAAGVSADFQPSGAYILYAPIGIVVEHYLNGAWRTDSMFDGVAVTTGTVIQVEDFSSTAGSMRIRNTTGGSLSIYYNSMLLPSA